MYYNFPSHTVTGIDSKVDNPNVIPKLLNCLAFQSIDYVYVQISKYIYNFMWVLKVKYI